MLFGAVSPSTLAYQHQFCLSRTRRFGAGYYGVEAEQITYALSY
jgi:hypothetical protein